MSEPRRYGCLCNHELLWEDNCFSPDFGPAGVAEDSEEDSEEEQQIRFVDTSEEEPIEESDEDLGELSDASSW